MVRQANRRQTEPIDAVETAPRRRRKRGHPGLRKTFLVIAAVLGITMAAGSGVAIGVIRFAEATVQSYPSGHGATCHSASGCEALPDVTPCAKSVCNFLILGSDSRADLSKGQQSQFGNSSAVTGQRSDTIIVVHQDFARNRTTVISIPRDLRVSIPGHGMGKINSAFNYGPDMTVRTVERLIGMPINHYVEIDFEGFMSVVNALGGVQVCIDHPMIDTLAGLHLPHAGCYTLKGQQALAFVRARHVQGDAIPDFSRISRQQQFLRAALQEIQSPTQIAHVGSLIDALSKDFVRDKGLSLYTIKDLSAQLATVGQGNVDFRVVPAVPLAIGGVDYVALQQPAARKFFAAVREGKSLGKLGQGFAYTPISPAQITVQVFDANSGGKVDTVVSYLERAGFAVLGVKPADPSMTRSEILYAAGQQKVQAVVSSYLPRMRVVFAKAGTPGAGIYVVVGPDFNGIDG